MKKHPSNSVLFSLLEGSLPKDAEHRLRQHIEHCAVCMQSLDFEKQLTRSIEELPLAHPSPQFDGHVLSELQHSKAIPHRPLQAWMRPVITGLLITTTLLVIILAGGSGEEQSQSVLTPVFEYITDVMSPVTDQFHEQITLLTPSVDAADNHTIRIFLIASLALLVIGSLDRLLLPIIRHRERTG
ncbi:MAG: hypothetical protein C0600_07075 [Ignavibacteria bacterium]|mgnify:CR=1 FL=1|nr:MAG: hypothetical protein C0600_07075 [Ignavibacteria bacterium]